MSRKRISKVIILGDSAVGKTSLLNSYVDQKFLQSYKATVGADFMEKEIVVDGKVINLEIWDTAGQEKFRSLGGAFYRGADCCAFVYDITNKGSFDNIESWITEFLNQGNPKDPENFPFVLIGNKVDREEDREVDDYLLRQFLLKYPKIKHLTTSAKDSLGVETAFQTIARSSVQNIQFEVYNVIMPPKIVGLPNPEWRRKQRQRCC